ncbi:MAG TPA: hypothetical protein PLA25_07310, partial [Anaerolineaceae bacterium]|nr:hypothetical protein [Anaerolineaceae bacterium]
MSIQVAPGVEKPTHHISLTGKDRWGRRTTIGITAVNRAGQPDIGAITSSPYPRTTVKIDTQEGTFVQMRPPFSRFSRNEFGGLGFLEGDADRTKYALGRKIWTAGGNSILMAPRLRRATIAYPVITLKGWGEDLTWIEMDSSTRRIIAGLVAAPTAAITAVQIRARVYHSRLKVTIYDDNGTGGIPGTVLGSGTGPAAGLDDTYMVELDSAVTATGNIWIGVETLAESEPHNRLGMYSSAAETGMYSANGTTWTAETSAYKMPSLGLRAQSGRANEWHFFEYRDGTYVVTGQRLFINGDRG